MRRGRGEHRVEGRKARTGILVGENMKDILSVRGGIPVDPRPYLNLRWEDLGKNPCWVLLREVYREAGVDISDYESYVEHISGEHEKLEGVQDYFAPVEGRPVSGDVVVIWRVRPAVADHLGLYVDNGKFLHISKGRGVTMERLSSPAWKRRIIGLWRWKGLQG